MSRLFWENRKMFQTVAVLVVAVLLCWGGIFWGVPDKKSDNLIVEKEVAKSTLEKKIVANFVITPHHLLAEKEIENIFKIVAEKNKKAPIEKVLLITPNHFNLGGGLAITTNKKWNFSGGELLSDASFVGRILNKEIIYQDDKAFLKEHGVLNLLPFIKKYFPAASLTALMIREDGREEKLDEIAKIINENIDEKMLVVLSSDFSHYLDQNFSAFHDQKAIDVIGRFGLDEVLNLETDCVGGLRILLQLAKLRGYQKFGLVSNTNSSKIYGKNFIGENTSYVTGYFKTGSPATFSHSISLLFAGDLMLDRENRTILAGQGSAFATEKIERLFWGQDLNVLNLEGPITDKQSVSTNTLPEDKKNLIFTFDPSDSLNFLKNNRINLVSLANNHSFNFGVEGATQTKDFLNSGRISFFGDSLENPGYFSRVINGQRIALVALNMFGHPNLEEVLPLVKELDKKNDWVVVYPHWGIEYALEPSLSQTEIARKLIDAGADLIIGSHPHVVQPIEIYKNRAIFYSLGNFWFDQYFSPETLTGLSIGVRLSSNKAEFYLMPLITEKIGQLNLAKEPMRKNLLERIARNSLIGEGIKKSIQEGRFSVETEDVK